LFQEAFVPPEKWLRWLAKGFLGIDVVSPECCTAVIAVR
jgi:hypothetical protein